MILRTIKMMILKGGSIILEDNRRDATVYEKKLLYVLRYVQQHEPVITSEVQVETSISLQAINHMLTKLVKQRFLKRKKIPCITGGVVWEYIRYNTREGV